MKNRADILIIGGGTIGSGIAYTLAKDGRSVILLEKGEPCSGAGGSTDGIIALHTKVPGMRLKMGLASAKMFPSLLDELGNQCEYRENCGGYILCEDQEEFDSVASTVMMERADGVDVRMIYRKELLDLEPNISPHMYGAKYACETSIIDTFALIFAYLKRAGDYGARMDFFTEVTGYIREGGKVKGVHTTKGDYFADLIVNCTGAWAGVTSRPLGLEIPIKPKRGQIVISEQVGPFCRGAFASATYIALKFFPEKQALLPKKMRELGNAFGLEQTASGTLMIASTRELADFDKRTTLDGIETVLKTAVRYMPRLNEISFIRTFSGFRPFCEDTFSVLGGVDGLEGYAVIAGHEGDGISLSPLINRLFMQYLNREPGQFDLSRFSPQRFVS